MNIDYGKVERYVGDRGFGFVSHTFKNDVSKGVFFHIKIVKRTHPILAQSLDSPQMDNDIYFWYEFGTSTKGQEVVAILDLDEIRHKYTDHIVVFIDIIKKGWMNTEKPLPESVRKATFELLTSDETSQLATNRERLATEQKRHCEEMQRAEADRLQKMADQRAAQEKAEVIIRQKIADQLAADEKAKDDEFIQLVAEISALGFTHSRQVSAYIVQHRLGCKYKHISGILQMELGGEVWNFNGGFPPNIYARLCAALELRNQGSQAKPLAFTPYKDIIDH